MRIFEKLVSLIGIKVTDKTSSQVLLEETLKNNPEKEPRLVNRYSPKNNLER